MEDGVVYPKVNEFMARAWAEYGKEVAEARPFDSMTMARLPRISIAEQMMRVTFPRADLSGVFRDYVRGPGWIHPDTIPQPARSWSLGHGRKR